MTSSHAAGPLTRSDAARLGIPLATLLGRGYRRVFHGVYVAAHLPDTTLVRTQAALRVAPTAVVVSHHTAAELWGGVVPRQPDVHLAHPGSSRWEGRAGVRIHRASTDGAASHLGLMMTSPVRTFLDLAAHLELVDLVVLADSLVRRGRVTQQQLVGAAAASDVRWVRRARRAASLARAEVDSPQETRLRMLVVLAGLPEPKVNHIFRRDDGTWRRRSEMVWEDLRIALEYDGRQHAEDPGQWAEDLERREFLDGEQWRLVVVRAAGLDRDAGRTLERILTIRASRGARPLRRVRPEWERYFPGFRSAR